MKLVPSLTTKTLDSCTPGELILFREQAVCRKALVAGLPEKNATAVALIRLEGMSPLTWIEITNGPLVLSYGHDYMFVPKTDRVFDGQRQEWEQDGAMLIGESDVLIRIPSASTQRPVYYNISDGIAKVTGRDPHKQIATLDWNIWLSNQKPDESPFYSFSAP